MNLDKLHFFDSDGYELNFEFNDRLQCWEGSIFLPKVSVGLYSNTTIYVLEEIQNNNSNSNVDVNQFLGIENPDEPVSDDLPTSISLDNIYFFPQGTGKITFSWDKLNKFVDEFFMFNFDTDYVLTETSALVYTPNDGPDCNTLIINTFDTYEVPLDNEYSSKALPIHIAFMANEKYDATTYNRTLVMSYEGRTIARITFYEETVEEDERLKIWNANLGYNITPEDTMIFYKSDIKEYRPDYILLNEKRKELMLEGSNIYPYIGSYRAIINAIKFFGYDNLNIIEYWRCVNPDDENFGKIYHSSRYSLTKKETLTIGARKIVLPNKDYKKINALALVYDINKPTGDIDEWELPLVKEQFAYTIEEALIKLFALRKKLNKEFMPGTSRIIDIIGEAHYFGIHGLFKVHDEYDSTITNRELNLDFELIPNKYTHITDNEYFDRYINFKKNNNSINDISLNNIMLSDIFNSNLQELGSYDLTEHALKELKRQKKNNKICEYYKEYYREVFVDHTIYKSIMNNDDYPYVSNEYDYTGDPYEKFSGKVVLNNTTFKDTTFENCELKFGCTFSEWQNNYRSLSLNTGTYDNITFGNIDTIIRPDTIRWNITMSKDQVDEDLKNIGIYKEYEYHTISASENARIYLNLNSGDKPISEYNQFFAELPYLGYYDVSMTLTFRDGRTQTRTKKKFIKVEPYQIDIIGFYYDARSIPVNLQSVTDEESQIYQFVQNSISHMHGWATAERTTLMIPKDLSMPYWTAEGDIAGKGPYYNDNMEYEWYLADNITYEMGLLKPLVKYTRYIRSGVDVKPYTWFLLGYEYSKITGKVNPKWTIKNNTTGVEQTYTSGNFNGYNGKYFTLLLKKEGNYTITLDLEDKNGNKYTTSRNIIVVSKTANYKLYQPFKKDYDYMVEQDMLLQLNEFNAQNKENGDDDGETPEEGTRNVFIDGIVREYPRPQNVAITGTVRTVQVSENVTIQGVVRYIPEEQNVAITGVVRSVEEQNVGINGTVRLIPDVLPVRINGNVRYIQYTSNVPVYINGNVRYSGTMPVNITGVVRNISSGEIIDIDVEGTIFNTDTLDVPVDITGIVKNEVPVDITGIVKYEVDEIPVYITGTVLPTYEYRLLLDEYDSQYFDNAIVLNWYKDEQMTQPITDGRVNLGLNSAEEEVWVSISGIELRAEPSTAHLTISNPTVNVDIIQHWYRIILQNDPDVVPWTHWYADEECTQFLNTSASNYPYIFTGEDEVWAVLTCEGYRTQTVHLVWDSSLGEGELMSASVKLIPSEFTYSITVSPEEANSIATIQWYEDSELTTPISDATGYELTSELLEVWVKISADGFRDKTVRLYGVSDTDTCLHLDVEMSPDDLVINAIPMIEWETNYPNSLKTSAEGTRFPLILSNNRNEIVDYTVSVENTYTRTSQQNFTYLLPQINIGNEYSIIICDRRGYNNGGLNQTTGTYTISADNSNTITFSISSAITTEHDSEPRLHTGPRAYVWLDIMPYASENKNFDIELIGLADGAAEIDGNTVKYYENREGGSDVPTKEKTYCCYPNYKYFIQNVGYETLSFDGDDMFSNINLSVGKLYSNLTYTVLPNNSNRLRFGIIRVTPADNDNFCYVAYIQENQNIRFVTDKSNTNILDMIDLSNHGHTYVIDLPKQTSTAFELCFKNTDIVDKVTVTSTTGVETTVSDYNGSKRYRFITNKAKDGSYYYDGFHITIN